MTASVSSVLWLVYRGTEDRPFRAVCRCVDYAAGFCVVYHGTEGPVVVDDMASTLLADKFVLAGQELGFEHVDVTAQKQFGE